MVSQKQFRKLNLGFKEDHKYEIICTHLWYYLDWGGQLGIKLTMVRIYSLSLSQSTQVIAVAR